MEALPSNTPDPVLESLAPVKDPRQEALKAQAKLVHETVAAKFGWPTNRKQRRVHEARVRKILEKLPAPTVVALADAGIVDEKEATA